MRKDSRKSNHPILGQRFALLLVSDALVAAVSLAVALLLRFDGRAPPHFGSRMAVFAPIAVALLIVPSLLQGLYGSVLQYASLRDMVRLAWVVVLAVLGLTGATMIHYAVSGERPLPLSVPLIWGPILFLGTGACRISGRLRAQVLTGKLFRPQADRVLIVGAGDAGEHVAREMLRDRNSKFLPVGFVDDDTSKIGRRIHGLPIFGPHQQIAEAVAKTAADQVIIAIPSAPSSVIRAVVKLVGTAGLKAKILPSLGELMGAAPTTADIRDVDISDLIARAQVKTDLAQIASVFDERTVLITGAAGSIGSELSRQALYFKPSTLVLLDNNETDLFYLVEKLRVLAGSRGTKLQMVVADIRDKRRIHEVFRLQQPSVVFHAAAYKHVPVMEVHPHEAVLTNVTGTKNVAQAADVFGTERLVLVSTDKAVHPTSVMGATKRIAELVTAMVNSESQTVFTSVRFGNVLGSRGSVVPLFKQQIREGGPITISHPDATRYFMTIEEAVALICQAGALAKGGETMVLEMGEPVRIIDLARRMQDLLADEESDNLEIVVTGLRPGEKIHESLWHEGETLAPIRPGILQSTAPFSDFEAASFWRAIAQVEELAQQHGDSAELVRAIFRIAKSVGNAKVLMD